MCALITIAMQLTCTVDKEIACTENQSLSQLLNVPSCEQMFSHQDAPDVFSVEERLLN
jgi:hypothetical protein